MKGKDVLQKALQPFVLVRVKDRLDAKKSVAEQFHIQAVPTIIVLDGQNREIDRVVGYGGPLWTVNRLDEIRNGKTMSRVMAQFRSKKKHTVREINWFLATLLRRSLYGEAVAEAERYGPQMLTAEMRDQIFQARLQAFSALYWDAAAAARKSGWTRLTLPSDPAQVAGPDLVGLVVESERGVLPTGPALRRALREARISDSDRYLGPLLGEAGNWPRRKKLLQFAVRNDCRRAVALLVKDQAWMGIDRLDSAQLTTLINALTVTRTDPQLEDRLADRLCRIDSSIGALVRASEARYLAGRRDLAIQGLQELQRRVLHRGLLALAHWAGSERRQMAAGTWAPRQPWIATWPEP